MGMATEQRRTGRAVHALPLEAVAEALAVWERRPDTDTMPGLQSALSGLLRERGVHAADVHVSAPPWPTLQVHLGALGGDLGPHRDDAKLAAWRRRRDVEHFDLVGDGGRVALGEAWLEGRPSTRADAARSLEMALDLSWSRAEARAAAERFDALNAATAAITAEPTLNRVLQLIVDRVRPLVGAEYAALGIVGEHGMIERFITSGISEEDQRRIGHPPVGRGLLGIVFHENRPLRVPDVMADPRRAGFPVGHPPMTSFLGVPVQIEGTSIGRLYLTNKKDVVEFTVADERLVEMFARHAGIAIHNARLHEEVQRMAVLQERERIGQDLHDGVIQGLYAVGLSLEDIGEQMAADPTEAEARVERAIDSIHSTIRDIRNFIFSLRPEYLEDSDLGGGLAALADEFRRSTLIDVDLDLATDLSVPPEVAMHVLQLGREALSNVARHSGATRVIIDLTVDERSLRLTIADNGRGYDTTVVPPAGHRGLGNMRGRAEALGGSLIIESGSEGTRVVFELPAQRDREPEESRE